MVEANKTIEELKEEVFIKYFKKDVLVYPVSNSGQSVTSYLTIKDGRLNKHFETIKQKYMFKRSWQDLQSEYIFQSWSAIHKFETVEGEKGWLQILNEVNSFEENKLIKYIKSSVYHKMNEFVNPNAFRTTTTKNGERVHYTLVMEFESLDNLLTQEIDGSAQTVQLTDENNAFNTTMYYYYVSYFQKWYEENKDRILTKTQVKFLDDLRRCSNDMYLTAEQFEQETGVKWSDRSRRLKKIEERIEKYWNREKPNKQSRKQIYDSPKLKYFQEYVDILNDDNTPLVAQNLLLTNHLVKGMTNEKVEKDVFEVVNDAVAGEALIEFNRLVKDNNSRNVALTGESLYKITALIEGRLNKLKEEKDKKVTEEVITGKPRKAKKKKMTELITYDKDGNVFKHEYKLEQDVVKHGNIHYILPTGATTQQR